MTRSLIGERLGRRKPHRHRGPWGSPHSASPAPVLQASSVHRLEYNYNCMRVQMHCTPDDGLISRIYIRVPFNLCLLFVKRLP